MPTGEILPRHLWIPERGINELELAIDVDFFQLRGQDYRRIAPSGKVARRYLNG
jgi:hypothetical protein